MINNICLLIRLASSLKSGVVKQVAISFDYKKRQFDYYKNVKEECKGKMPGILVAPKLNILTVFQKQYV